MAKTVQDILVNVDSGDLLFSAGDMKTKTFFKIVWGVLFDGDDEEDVLYANVIIPSNKLNSIEADGASRFLIYATSTYYPNNSPFTVRLVLDNNGTYEKIEQGTKEYPVISLAYLPNSDNTRVMASELPNINIDGNYMIELQIGETSNSAYIYTADTLDIQIGGSDLQSSQLLSICEPGKYYRYPTTGIGTTNFIGSVVKHTNLGEKIVEQFKNNGLSVQDADFDAQTGELQVTFFNEKIEDDDDLLSTDQLDIESLDITDEALVKVASEINFDDYNEEYDDFVPEIDVPDAIILSCFANGIWIGEYPWTGSELWKGQQ